MAKKKSSKQARSKLETLMVDGKQVKLSYYVGKYEGQGNYMVAVDVKSSNMIVDREGVPIPFSKINKTLQ
jgi:hypothetical protein